MPTSSLDEYDQKRDFAQTPEPGPDAVARPSATPRFMVHKHHARRLHYDLRLEIDGALASWAVPRGPSYDPSIKRLAVQTEDHPLAYGDFEGRIPDGQYGAGDSLVWDRGLYDTVPPGQVSAQRKKGHIHFALAGEKLRGEWHLLRTTAANGRRAAQGDFTASGPKSQWLLIKLDDEEANPKLDIVVEHPESVLTGRIDTQGPAKMGSHAPAVVKPSMPVLLSTGVLGSEPKGIASEKPRRAPTPLFAEISLADFHIDVSKPQQILELPGHLFGESPGPVAAAAQLPELLFLLEGAGRSSRLGPVSEVALVMRDLFSALGLQPMACAAGPASLLVRAPIAPAPPPGAIERFAERIAETLASQLELLRDGEVKLDGSLNKPGAHVPALLEPLAVAPKIVCVPLAWDDLSPELALTKLNARYLEKHREALEAAVAAHRANAKPLPRAR